MLHYPGKRKHKSVRHVRLSLLHLEGEMMFGAPPHKGWLVHVNTPIRSGTLNWRVVRFDGDSAATSLLEVPLDELIPVLPALERFCTGPLDVGWVFDTSDVWTEVDLAVVLDGDRAQRQQFSWAASGFQGDDAPVLAAILDAVEIRAGLRPR